LEAAATLQVADGGIKRMEICGSFLIGKRSELASLRLGV
jgi:hypothetical protein